MFRSGNLFGLNGLFRDLFKSLSERVVPARSVYHELAARLFGEGLSGKLLHRHIPEVGISAGRMLLLVAYFAKGCIPAAEVDAELFAADELVHVDDLLNDFGVVQTGRTDERAHKIHAFADFVCRCAGRGVGLIAYAAEGCIAAAKIGPELIALDIFIRIDDMLHGNRIVPERTDKLHRPVFIPHKHQTSRYM